MRKTGYISGTKAALDEQAEAIGRKYAEVKGLAWPMPPEVYGPGRQPEPRAQYYQTLYLAPLGAERGFPERLEIDDEVQAMHGLQVRITGNKNITINLAAKVDLP